MSRHPAALLIASALVGCTALALAACGGSAPSPADDSAATPSGAAVTPTVVARLLPTSTPTVDPKADPWFAVADPDLRDVPVPIGAKRVAFAPATADLDAAAEYSIDDFDADKLVDWYKDHMTAFGWGLDSEEDGSYVFLHTTEKSARFADKGLKRTATLLLSGSTDEADWTLLVEAPKGAAVSATESNAPSEAPAADTAAPDEGTPGATETAAP
ncbi:MAG: hypothetical protein ABI780_06530 [Ardenticatenales bacterium]